MDLHHIENIICIADEKSITRAAEKRFITQSALNQQLQKLEEELGCPLFVRSRGNWHPTEAGRVYIETAREMVMMRKEAYAKITDIAEKARRYLAVGLIPERGVDMFTAVYPEFHAEFPQVRVEPIECHVGAMQRMITEGQLDLGLATLTEKQKDENVYHLLAEEEILLAVPVENILSKDGSKQPQTAPVTELERFAETPFVRIYRRSTLYDVTQPLFDAAGFEPTVLFSTSSNVSKFRIVEAGLSCALLPMTYARQSDKVRYFRLPRKPVWQITMCSRKNGYMGKMEQAYISLCRHYWQNRTQNCQ